MNYYESFRKMAAAVSVMVTYFGYFVYCQKQAMHNENQEGTASIFHSFLCN